MAPQGSSIEYGKRQGSSTWAGEKTTGRRFAPARCGCGHPCRSDRPCVLFVCGAHARPIYPESRRGNLLYGDNGKARAKQKTRRNRDFAHRRRAICESARGVSRKLQARPGRCARVRQVQPSPLYTIIQYPWLPTIRRPGPCDDGRKGAAHDFCRIRPCGLGALSLRTQPPREDVPPCA